LKWADDAVAALHESGLGAARTEVPTGEICKQWNSVSYEAKPGKATTDMQERIGGC
jgi:hypothetical protein